MLPQLAIVVPKVCSLSDVRCQHRVIMTAHFHSRERDIRGEIVPITSGCRSEVNPCLSLWRVKSVVGRKTRLIVWPYASAAGSNAKVLSIQHNGGLRRRVHTQAGTGGRFELTRGFPPSHYVQGGSDYSWTKGPDEVIRSKNYERNVQRNKRITRRILRPLRA